MKKDLISIISPVYNTEKYLKQCIESVLSQTHKEFELIMVVDASPDNSISIIEDYAKKDNRIKLVINEKNLGLSHTRFEGLKVSKGEYIMHVDSDDWIPPDAVEKLYNKIEDENADIVYGSFCRVLDRYGMIKRRGTNNYGLTNIEKSISQPDLFEEYYISYFGVNKLRVSMCGKLYRKSATHKADLKPTKMTMGEDLLFNLQLHPYLNKVAFISDVVYYYRWGGMTNKQNPTFLRDIKQQYIIKKEKINQYSYFKALPYIKTELVNCFYSHFLNHLLIDGMTKEKVKSLVIEELDDKIYTEELAGIDSAKAKAIYTKDIETIADQILGTYQKQKRIYKIKRFLNSLLS